MEATMRTAAKAYAPAASMVYVQVSYGVMYVLTRFSFTKGMSRFAFVFYRQLFTSILIYSALFCFNPRDGKLGIKWRNLRQIFLLSLVGITIAQNLYYAGLSLTSSTFASSMNNLQPVVTFLLAYFLRLEEVRIETRTGQAKILGTVLCALGTMLMTFFKGQDQGLGLQYAGISAQHQLGGEDDYSFILGAFLTCVGSWSISVFLIYQAKVLHEYPSQLALSGHVSFVGSLQCAAAVLAFDGPAAFVLGWDFQLLTIIYSGTLATGMGFFMINWVVKERGPVFATAFNPLSSVLVAVLEPFVLHVQLTWTSLAGMVIIIGGLYMVLWGKAQEGVPTASQISDHGERRQGVEEAGDNRQPLLPKTNSYVDVI